MDQKIFGANTNLLVKEKFEAVIDSYRETHICTYKEQSDEYYCQVEAPNGDWSGNADYRYLKEAKKINNEIIIYDYFVLTYGIIENGTCYRDWGKKYKIDICDKIWDEKTIEEYLKSSGQLYKHVFKQNDNGSYFWYSSEPVV